MLSRILLVLSWLVPLFAAASTSVELRSWMFSRPGDRPVEVVVPHDWAIEGPFDESNDRQTVAINENGEKVATDKTGRTGALPWIGRGEYRTNVEIPDGTEFVALVFDGAMNEPEVFYDGRKVGEWKTGYNAFEVVLPADPGRHEVLVKLTNRPESSRWYPGAGLIRPVRLVLGNAVGIKTWGTSVWTPDLETVQVKTECRGDVGRIRYAVLDGGREIVRSETGVLKAAFEPWSPESPRLYTLVTEVYDKSGRLSDSESLRFGVRTLKYGKNGFALNGKGRKFKGVCIHHDLGPLGAAFDADAFRRQVTLLKEMGCDSIRTAHNMPGQGQLDVCDEMGMMVMAESFDAWERPKLDNDYSRFFPNWWKRDLENLVRKCRSHPCVVMWSIGNEVSDQRTSRGRELAVKMQEWCHRFDPDAERKVTQGLSWMPQAIESGVNGVMEIPAVTYRLPFYGQMRAASRAGFVLGAETASTVSSRGAYHFPVAVTNCPRHTDLQCSGYDVECCPWSNLPDDDFAVQDDCGWTIGQFVWTGFDYLGEPSPYDESWPSRSSYFGIFDLAGLPKDRYWLYRSQWRRDVPTLHVLPHWTWPGREGQIVPVYAYTSYPCAELFVNGRSHGKRRFDRNSRLDRYRLRWNDCIYEPGEIKVVAYDDRGVAVASQAVRTAGKVSGVRVDRRRFGRLLFSEVTLVDGSGCPVPDADDELLVTVGKGLRLRALCNGDPTSLEPFVGNRMKAFHGKLLVICEGDGDDGLSVERVADVGQLKQTTGGNSNEEQV